MDDYLFSTKEYQNREYKITIVNFFHHAFHSLPFIEQKKPLLTVISQSIHFLVS